MALIATMIDVWKKCEANPEFKLVTRVLLQSKSRTYGTCTVVFRLFLSPLSLATDMYRYALETLWSTVRWLYKTMF
jgi:hypothetical protein